MRGTTRRIRRAATVGANLVPLVGVVWLDWNVWSLVAIYWVEAFASVLGGAAKAVVAQRGSQGTNELGPVFELRDKRGGWQPHAAVPPIYPRNVPLAVRILGLWFGIAVPISGVYWVVVGEPSIVSTEFVFGVIGLLVARLVGFYTEYLAPMAYTDVSAREILATPLGVLCVVLFVGFVGVGAGKAGAVVAVAGVAVVRTVAAVRDVSDGPVGTTIRRIVDRVTADREWGRPPPEPELPDAPVEARVPVTPLPVVLGSLPQVPLGLVNWSGGVVVCSVGAAALLGRPVVMAVATGMVVSAVTVRVGSYYLRYGTIEYQRRGDQLVAYDTALDAPQWVTPVERTATATTHNAVSDRLLSHGRLTISGVESGPTEEVQLGPVGDLDAAIETLDLPVHRGERPDRNLAVVAAAVVLAGFFGIVPVSVVVSPAVDTAGTVAVAVVTGPYLLLLIGGLVWAGLTRI